MCHCGVTAMPVDTHTHVNGQHASTSSAASSSTTTAATNSLVRDLIAEMTIDERIRVVVLYFKHGESMTHLRRALRRFYGDSGQSIPHERVLLAVVQLFCDTGSVLLLAPGQHTDTLVGTPKQRLHASHPSSMTASMLKAQQQQAHAQHAAAQHSGSLKCRECSREPRPPSSSGSGASSVNSQQNNVGQSHHSNNARGGSTKVHMVNGTVPQQHHQQPPPPQQQSSQSNNSYTPTDDKDADELRELARQELVETRFRRFVDDLKQLRESSADPEVTVGAVLDFDDLLEDGPSFAMCPQAELSQFQKDKFAYLFYQFYDVDRNGYINHQDFKETLKALKKFRRWGLSDPRFSECEYVTRSAWQALKAADLDRDNKVSLEEWQMYWATFIHKSQQASAYGGWPPDCSWVKDYMNFWFDLMDAGGDGTLEEDEYVEVTAYYGVPADSAKTCFKKFATQPVNREYFGTLWLQYMTSDDKLAPGNFVFGNCKWK